MLKRILAVSLLFLIVIRSEAQPPPVQSKQDLEKERAAIQKEIDDVRQSLEETHKNKRETLGQLNLLQRRLKLRESAIRNINAQIDVIQGDMNSSWRDITKLRSELDTLRIQYAQSIVFAYKNRSSYDFLNFIFSATSFNDAVRRGEYLKSYRQNREQQVAEIIKTEGLITHKARDFATTKVAKGEVLTNDSKARAKLEEEKPEKDEVVSGLKSRERELAGTIASKKRDLGQLQLAIKTAIRHEIELAKKEEAKKMASAPSQPTASGGRKVVVSPGGASTNGTDAGRTVHPTVLLD